MPDDRRSQGPLDRLGDALFKPTPEPGKEPLPDATWGEAINSLGSGIMFMVKVAAVLLVLAGAGVFALRWFASGSPSISVITVVDSRGSDECSGLLDYCVRVTCTVKNEGPLQSNATVEMTVQRGGKPDLSHVTTVPLAVGESKQISHDFDDARLFDDNTTYKCEPR